MCNTSLHHRTGFGDAATIEPLSLSTFHFLRTCNRFMIPPTDCHSYYGSLKENGIQQFQHNETHNSKSVESIHTTVPSPPRSPILDVIETISLPAPTSELNNTIQVTEYTEKAETNQKLELFSTLATTETVTESEPLSSDCTILKSNDLPILPLPSLPLFPPPSKPTLPGFEYITATNPNRPHGNDIALMELNRFSGMFPAFLHRRPRGEKRPIPEEQKDEKYYERRKRNNEAAKKSRDARKIREDRIAFRAALLEQENSILRAQVLALRDELRTVRQLVNNSVNGTLLSSTSTSHMQV